MARGGKREGAGRKPGFQLRRSASDVLKDLEERHPGWSPLQLLAEVANDEAQPIEVRIDAAKAAAVFMHPRPKPIEMEPDALVALEERMAKVRFMDHMRMSGFEGLAERLARAAARREAHESADTEATRSIKATATQEPVTEPPAAIEDDQEEAERLEGLAARLERASARRVVSVASEPEPKAYVPISPLPEPIHFSGPAIMMDDEYNPYGDK